MRVINSYLCGTIADDVNLTTVQWTSHLWCSEFFQPYSAVVDFYEDSTTMSAYQFIQCFLQMCELLAVDVEDRVARPGEELDQWYL